MDARPQLACACSCGHLRRVLGETRLCLLMMTFGCSGTSCGSRFRVSPPPIYRPALRGAEADGFEHGNLGRNIRVFFIFLCRNALAGAFKTPLCLHAGSGEAICTIGFFFVATAPSPPDSLLRSRSVLCESRAPVWSAQAQPKIRMSTACMTNQQPPQSLRMLRDRCKLGSGLPVVCVAADTAAQVQKGQGKPVWARLTMAFEHCENIVLHPSAGQHIVCNVFISALRHALNFSPAT